jgi:hypothetical protein
MKKSISTLLFLFLVFCANAQTADTPSSYAFKKLHEQNIDTTKICFNKCTRAGIYETRAEKIGDSIKTYRLLIQKEYTEYCACICDKSISDSISTLVTNKLNKRGYDCPPNDSGYSCKGALIKFQKDNDLFIGALTLETMKNLGFSFEELGLLLKK